MGTIRVEGNPSYIVQTSAVLGMIQSNPAGQAIVMRIKSSPKTLRLIPYDDTDCNASTKSANPSGSAPAGVSGKLTGGAKWYAGHPDDPMTRSVDERFSSPTSGGGTGAGSNVTIKFTPHIYGAAGCFKGYYGSLADEVLLHEMVHALRSMQGRLNAVPTGDSFTGYMNEEEFLAIVAANVYISAKGSPQLRADHSGHSPLRSPLDTSAGFLTDAGNLKLMNIHRLLWTDTFNALSKVTAKFNPFRELNEKLAHLGPVR